MTQTIALSAARFWRNYPREAVVVGVLGVAAATAVAGATWSGKFPTSTVQAVDEVAPPAPPPLLVRDVAPEDALKLNSAIPLANGPNPAATPFNLAKASAADRARAIECLTSAVYYEAGNESDDGQRAVAQVVLNRVRHPAFPSTVCGVVFQGSTRATGCQFTFTCDGSLTRAPMAGSWARARKVAEAALSGYVYAPAGLATHYHANYVVPYWASSLAKNAVVGAHIFYRWAGGWGRPPAFTSRYAGGEPNAAALKNAALAAEVANAAAAAQVAGATEGEPLKIENPKDLAAMDALFANGKPGANARVGVRFNPAARKAVEDAIGKSGSNKLASSENLRWSLSSEAVKADERPLGTKRAEESVSRAFGPVAGGAADQ
ncbi:cell wall hydrolase [Sphingomonas piscis]|uniref:Cell wall hydrolase n=1 Tax=Sphingomonas piscis TaxID=2714943 RepID=A0A6G7YLN2_9SPHN|nr:cell wall hydrolase [Sphingomonas piscis]QIK77648.1 cell wall hydrolase [Sphingomonas piscis]